MSLLTLVQNASDTIGLARPSAVVSSTDGNVRTLLSLANTEGRELLERFSWPATQLEATHTTLAAELQGVMTTIAPGFGYIINQTFWDRTALPACQRASKPARVAGNESPHNNRTIF
jgi:hypothetical protein